MVSSSVRSLTHRLAILALPLLAGQLAGAQQPRYSTAHRDAEQTLPQTVQASGSGLAAKLSAGRTPVSVAIADFDEDGTKDLVTGYAVGANGLLLFQAGDPHALAPDAAQMAEVRAGRTVAPFATAAQAISVPALPDLLVTADLAGHGHQDLALAAKGGNEMYLLQGQGDGSFGAPQALPLRGTVTALATWRDPDGKNVLAAGVCGAAGCGVQFVAADGSTEGFVALPDTPKGLEVAPVNNGQSPDLVVLTGNSVLVVDGRPR